MKIRITQPFLIDGLIDEEITGEEFEAKDYDEYTYSFTYKNKMRLILKIDCEIVIPSNRGKAIGMLALTEERYDKKVDLVEKLLNDIDSLNEKLSFFNEPKNHEKERTT